jgi:hypothetical protein
VLFRRKDFNGLSAATSERIEQARVQALAEEDMGGEGSEHGWVPGLFSHLRRLRLLPHPRHGRLQYPAALP